MLAHLFKLIASQWKSNYWILAELFFSFVCLWIVVRALLMMCSYELHDAGFDIDHVYKVSFKQKSKHASDFNPDSDKKEEVKTLVNRIRRYPGVEAVGFTGSTYPYSSSLNRMPCSSDTAHSVLVAYDVVSSGIVPVFRYQPADKRMDLKKEAEQEHWLVSRSVMDNLFGKGVYKGEITVGEYVGVMGVGVTSDYARLEYQEQPFVWKVLSDDRFIKEKKGGGHLFLRVSPWADSHFIDRFLKEMRSQLVAGNSMVTNLVPMSAVREETLIAFGINSCYTLLYFLGSFFILCAFLGVIGTFWFRVQTRTAEIGLRMAFGSTRKEILRLLVGEGLLLFALVWIPGMVTLYFFEEPLSSAMNAGYGKVEMEFSIWSTVLSTLLMVLLIIAGIWYPARQASRINPVDALRDE